MGGEMMVVQTTTVEENFSDTLESKIYNAGDREFLKFIDEEFYKLKSEKVIKYKENIKCLKQMDSDLVSTALARLSYLEEAKDGLKGMTFFSGITILVITAYLGFVESIVDFEKISPVVYFISVLTLYIIFTFLINTSRHDKSLVLFFKSLINSFHK